MLCFTSEHFQCFDDAHTWVTFLKGLVPGIPAALVTVAVALVAWRQYRVARAKLNLDLFDKRLAIFEATWIFLSDTIYCRHLSNLRNQHARIRFEHYCSQLILHFLNTRKSL